MSYLTSMYVRQLLIFLCVSFISVEVYSQGFTISGRVIDAETNEPLQFAHVFIDQTTHGTTTNTNGEFILSNLEAGEYRLVFSFVGFDLFNRSVSVTDKDMIVNARLVPQNAILQNIEVKGTKDKEWEKRLKDFNRFFLGEDEFAKECLITNPWVIDFNFNKTSKTLIATASQPIEIENKALGYQISCSLQSFVFAPQDFQIKGLYRFKEMEATSDEEAKRWTHNRHEAYLRSFRFFFKSVVENNLESNGYEVFIDKKPKDYLLNSAYFSDEFGKRVFKPDLKKLIIPYTTPGIFKLMTPDRLEVHHLNTYAQIKAYRDLSRAVSWLEFPKGYILISQDGIVVNRDDVLSVGEFNNNRTSSMLPLNYQPGRVVVVNYLTKVNVALRMRERIYAHTDKAFYQPGEKVNIKVYKGTANRSLRDSLSKVVYSEVIDISKHIKLSQKLLLQNNVASAEISLPAAMEPGIYFLRCYTRWMRNYGNENLFMTPICVSPLDKHISATGKVKKEGGDFIVSMSDGIAAREDVEISIQLDSASLAKWANGSLSISEAGVAAFPFAPGIKQSLEFSKNLTTDAQVELPYPLEYSMTLKGKFIHPKNKFVITELTAIRGIMDSVYHIKTDKNGYFKIENLNFFDSVNFSFQAKDKKGRIFGSTIVLQDNQPEVILPEINTSMLDTVATGIVIEKINKPLAEAKPVEKIEREEVAPSSNGGAVVISREMLERMPARMSIMDALSTVPGVQINPGTGKITLKGFNRSSNTEPLIVVDGLPYYQPQATKSIPQESGTQSTTQSGQNPRETQAAGANQSNQNTQQQTTGVQMTESALTSLTYLTTADVSRIEISTQPNARYGYAGVGGVISIYTRKVFGNEPSKKTLDVYRLMGYSNARTDLQTVENKSPALPYWNPSFTLSLGEQKKITFRAPNQPGLYLISIAAISEEGRPLQEYYYFKIDP